MKPIKADETLCQMVQTFLQRNEVYGDNYLNEAEVLAKLFPRGISLTTPQEHAVYGFLRSIVQKLTRFVNAGCNHKDSIHDAGVYCAMLEDFIAKNIINNE